MASERIRYFDIAKGILIILLVFAHFRSAIARMPFESPYFEYVYGWNNIFTCFYMPAFFLISGYCSNFKKQSRAFFNSLLKSLLLPIITLSLLTTIVTSLIYHENILNNIVKSISWGFGLWFLWAILWGKIIVYIIERIKINGGGKLFISFLLLVLGVFLYQFNVGPEVLYYKHALVASFWIYVGVYLRANPDLYEKSLKISWVLYPLVAVVTFFKQYAFVAGIGLSLPSIPIHLVYSFFGSMFLLAVCRKIGQCDWLEFWGKNSLVVYALHFMPLLYFANLLWEAISPKAPIIFIGYFLVLYTIEYIICWLIMKLFQYKPFIWLIGKF